MEKRLFETDLVKYLEIIRLYGYRLIMVNKHYAIQIKTLFG